MSRYMFDGMESGEKLLMEDEAFPLVREVSFKYGLKVFRVVEVTEGFGKSKRNEFYMAYPNGIPVCKVWAYKDSSGVQYNYRSPYYQKERGSDSADRETLHSIKLSTLMGSLKKNAVVPDVERIINTYSESWEQGVSTFASHFGNDSKDTYGVTADMAHALIRSYLGESPSTPNYILDRDICKKLLDKYETADKIKEKKEQEIKRAFHNPFYVVGADSEHNLVIAKVKRELVNEERRRHFKFTIIEDFKRVPNTDAFPDIIPIVTMLKVGFEGRYDKDTLFADFIPRYTTYHADYDVVSACRNYPSHFHFTWMLIPCSTTSHQ